MHSSNRPPTVHPTRPMPTNHEGAASLIIVGAGGHAKVVLDAAQAMASFHIVGIADERREMHGALVLGYPVLGGLDALDDPTYRDCQLVVAIGDGAAREWVSADLEDRHRVFATVIHPSAQVGVETEVGPGTVVLAGAVINSGAGIGRHVIVNTRSSVDHDCSIGDFAHIAPGATLAGSVSVGRGTHIGMGACVIEGTSIGAGCIVGAGAVVLTDVADHTVVVGVPAREMKRQAEIK